MSDTLALALALFAGALLGAFFFGGLWWTVQKGVSSESPAGCTLATRAKTPSTVLVLPTSMTRSMIWLLAFGS